MNWEVKISPLSIKLLLASGAFYYSSQKRNQVDELSHFKEGGPQNHTSKCLCLWSLHSWVPFSWTLSLFEKPSSSSDSDACGLWLGFGKHAYISTQTSLPLLQPSSECLNILTYLIPDLRFQMHLITLVLRRRMNFWSPEVAEFWSKIVIQSPWSWLSETGSVHSEVMSQNIFSSLEGD